MLNEILEALGIYKLYAKWLKLQIEEGVKPNHIGIILDGNRRWAASQEMISWEGHQVGAEKVQQFLQWCLDIGINTVTIYAFSTENFSRNEKEVEEIMDIFEETLEKVISNPSIHKNKVKVTALGRTNLLPIRIQYLIQEVEEATKEYDRFYLNVAVAYGGRAEIVDATREIAELVKDGKLEPSEINESIIEKHLYTAHLPQQEPDLIIRTSGEMRLSNFMVWQSAYSELFIVDVYWPQFREIDLERAIRSYQQRHRRYGK